MKRAMILGFSVVFGSAAFAQPAAPLPVSVYPGTTVPLTATQDATNTPPPATPAPAAMPTPPAAPAHSGHAGPLQPLASLLAMPLPTAPTVAAGACASGACPTASCGPACGAPLFPTTARDGTGKSRPCLDRVVKWLTWHPGPSILPVLTPTPYHAPLRAYFTCTPLKNPGYPAACSAAAATGAAPAGACASGTCQARPASGYGVATRPAADAPTPGSLALVIPLPAACAGPTDCGVGRSAIDRLLGQFAGGCTTCTTGSCSTPSAVTPVGYQSAAPALAR